MNDEMKTWTYEQLRDEMKRIWPRYRRVLGFVNRYSSRLDRIYTHLHRIKPGSVDQAWREVEGRQ